MRRGSERVLGSALLALAALYALWLQGDTGWAAVLLVFVAPPLLLGVAVWGGVRTAGFWAGVLALGWFSHAVMMAWAARGEALPALLATLLSLVIVVASSWPGLKARRDKKRAG